ncbi:hypothetical protein [Pedobacter puniceum]|uniref:Outer membrane beta-barrel protein n=1 Tax=Pedobacter puniceum TaxID=2666136 RepID=A0A7K0FL96_9SPHI|nr:hypothetical protein [Pedobacter puniceum]MRX46411.1 hypothetical protein [Pedobacter puniceum]
MRKLFTLALCSAISFSVFSKTDSTKNKPEHLKANKGTFSTELNVNPFNGQVNLNNSLNQIKVRYFISDLIALRLGLNVNVIKDLEDNNNPYGTNPFRYYYEKKSTKTSVNFGLEKHFKGTKRLSPYFGVDVSLENFSASSDFDNQQLTLNTKNIWIIVNSNNQQTFYSLNNRAYFQYGLNVFTGFDYYISKNFFFGYELGYGFAHIAYKTPEINSSGSTNVNFYSSEYTSFNVGTRLLNGIRLGYNF